MQDKNDLDLTSLSGALDWAREVRDRYKDSCEQGAGSKLECFMVINRDMEDGSTLSEPHIMSVEPKLFGLGADVPFIQVVMTFDRFIREMAVKTEAIASMVTIKLVQVGESQDSEDRIMREVQEFFSGDMSKHPDHVPALVTMFNFQPTGAARLWTCVSTEATVTREGLRMRYGDWTESRELPQGPLTQILPPPVFSMGPKGPPAQA